METLTGCMGNQLNSLDFKTIPNGSFRIMSSTKESKTIDFLNDLYTYPPQFRVKWDTIDELHDDLFMSYNYRVFDQSLPFVDTLNTIFQEETVEKTKYSLNSYIKGYLNKTASSRFYGKDTNKIQTSLQNVPIYVILNGQKEIILATSTDSLNSNTQNIKSLAYDFCGRFDPLVERSKQLGLFFMSRDDAEIYLNEIAKLDTQGTKIFGLSIHCFSLDFAYRVTRESHPGVDFRFIPDLKEVQGLITSENTGNSNLVFEDSQQQLRFRKRTLNIIPAIKGLNKWVSPFSSFLEKTEYFKGVPIYVVKTKEDSTNFIYKGYDNIVSLVDSGFGRIVKCINFGTGFGNNSIMQGSIQEQGKNDFIKTFVFFERKAAIDFCQKNSKSIIHYHGSQSKLVPTLIKKPRIFVYNLEDFLEIWEDKLTQKNIKEAKLIDNTIFDSKPISIMPPKNSVLDMEHYLNQTKSSSLSKVSNFLEFKYRRLTGFLQLFLNTN